MIRVGKCEGKGLDEIGEGGKSVRMFDTLVRAMVTEVYIHTITHQAVH